MGKIVSKFDGLFFNFLIPLVLTIGFILISLQVMGFDLKSTYSEFIKDIPFVSSFYSPDIKVANSIQSKSTPADVEKLKQKLAETEKSYQDLQQKYEEKQQELKQYQSVSSVNENQTVRSDIDQKTVYKKLAKVYIEMSPSKAAAILENLDANEAALLLHVMTVSQQGDLLSRMTPEKASKITILLKDQI
jgi:flagellar motility protein MotE (MotC chaperone)